VAIGKLKEIHTATLPAAKLERRGRPADGATEDAGDAREELLSSLAVEAAEEEGDGPSQLEE
jgi:hypothetical protein